MFWPGPLSVHTSYLLLGGQLSPKLPGTFPSSVLKVLCPRNAWSGHSSTNAHMPPLPPTSSCPSLPSHRPSGSSSMCQAEPPNLTSLTSLRCPLVSVPRHCPKSSTPCSPHQALLLFLGTLIPTCKYFTIMSFHHGSDYPVHCWVPHLDMSNESTKTSTWTFGPFPNPGPQNSRPLVLRGWGCPAPAPPTSALPGAPSTGPHPLTPPSWALPSPLPPGGDLEDEPPRWVWATRPTFCEKLSFFVGVRCLTSALPLAHLTVIQHTESSEPGFLSPASPAHRLGNLVLSLVLSLAAISSYLSIHLFYNSTEQPVPDIGDGNRGYTQTSPLLRGPESCGGQRCVSYLFLCKLFTGR